MLRSVANRILTSMPSVTPHITIRQSCSMVLIWSFPKRAPNVRTTALLQHNPSVTPVSRSKPQPWLLGRLITRRTGKRCDR